MKSISEYAKFFGIKIWTVKKPNGSIVGIGDLFMVDHHRNPKYGKLRYDDPRNDEVWEQRHIKTSDILESLQNQINELKTK